MSQPSAGAKLGARLRLVMEREIISLGAKTPVLCLFGASFDEIFKLKNPTLTLMLAHV